jgi:hypothetical protein
MLMSVICFTKNKTVRILLCKSTRCKFDRKASSPYLSGEYVHMYSRGIALATTMPMEYIENLKMAKIQLQVSVENKKMK